MKIDVLSRWYWKTGQRHTDRQTWSQHTALFYFVKNA